MKSCESQVAEITVSYRPAIGAKPTIKTALDAFVEIRSFFSEETIHLQEQFVVMYLNQANRVIGIYKASAGGITGTVVDPRIILGTALKVAAVSMVIAHNHPSGNLQPSRADVDLTNKIKRGCECLDIRLLDHLVISPEKKFFSMADEGLL